MSCLPAFKIRLIALGLAVALLLGGCSTQTPMSTLDAKGPIAQMQLDLFMLTLWVTGFIFVTVGGALVYALIRFRARPEDRDKPVPAQGHGSRWAELALAFFSITCLVIVAIPTVKGIWMMEELPDRVQEEGVINIHVTGYQWWWEFEYRNEAGSFVTANELVIPVNRVVQLHLRANDVLHSFWLPKLAGKQDLIPGRKSSLWIEANETGHYYGQCAEYCGEAHAYMLFRTDVLSQEDYAAWVERQQQPADGPDGQDWEAFYSVIDNPEADPAAYQALLANPIQDGARLFMTKGACVQCHAIRGSRAVGVAGPNLTYFGQRKTVGAGLLDNRPDKRGQLAPPPTPEVLQAWLDDDTQVRSGNRQLDNIYRWIRHSEDVKPGNLMYRSLRKLDSDAMLLTDAEFKRIAAYLQTLK